MRWVLIVVAVWVVLAFFVAVIIGRSIRLADRKAAQERAIAQARNANFVVDELGEAVGDRPAVESAGSHAVARRRVWTSPRTSARSSPPHRTRSAQ